MKLRISSRVTNVKRHTLGYVINRKFYTVKQVRGLAASNRIVGVRVVGNHIQSLPGYRTLASLPSKVNKDRRVLV